VKLHSGDIWFESHLDQGTTFNLKFPMSSLHELEQPTHTILPVPSSPEESTPVATGTKKPVILIAEDNEELRNLMVKNLDQYYQIHVADDGKQGLASARKIFPEVIVSDVMMPNMNGNEFCYEVKNNLKTSHIPFILLTALTTNEHKIESYKTGADTYLEKPFDLELLKSCIDNLLESRKRLKEKFSADDVLTLDGLTELDKKFIEQATKIAETNIANADFAIEDFEKEIGMSHASLYRKFKGLLDKTPLEFIQHYRLKKAMELLASGVYNVNEVAYNVGFSDPKYFSTVFKKHFGKNASEFLRDKRKP